jgi:hypothetical protein
MGPLTYFATAENALFNDGADYTRAGISISQAVPEPSTGAIMIIAIAVMGLRLWRKGRQAIPARKPFDLAPQAGATRLM